MDFSRGDFSKTDSGIVGDGATFCGSIGDLSELSKGKKVQYNNTHNKLEKFCDKMPSVHVFVFHF
jgi:hypothetical protein